MTFTIEALWSVQQLTERAMRQAILNQITEKACWRVGKYLGSMSYLDFGGEIQIPNKRQGMITQEEAMLGIRDCYWCLSRQMKIIVDSETISDDNATKKLKCIERMLLRDFIVHEGIAVDFVFSSNVVLSLDTTTGMQQITTLPSLQHLMGEFTLLNLTESFIFLTKFRKLGLFNKYCGKSGGAISRMLFVGK